MWEVTAHPDLHQDQRKSYDSSRIAASSPHKHRGEESFILLSFEEEPNLV